MPSPGQYRGTNWIIDPETGSFTLLKDGVATDTSASLGELTGGQYNLQSVGPGDILGYVTGPYSGRIWSTVNLQEPGTLHINQAGDIMLASPVDMQNVNEKMFAQGKYGATATVTYELPTGESQTFNVTSWLTRPQDRLLVREGSAPGDRNRYAYVTDITKQNEYIPQDAPSGWRFATPAEALDRGMIARIIEEQRQLVDDMVALGVRGPDGQPLRTPYEAAMYLATMLEEPGAQRVATLE